VTVGRAPVSRGWLVPSFGAVLLAVVAVVALAGPSLNGIAIRSTASASPSSPGSTAETSGLAAATPSASTSASPSAIPSSAPSATARVTIVVFRPHANRFTSWRLQVTLSGPAVYELDGVDTIPATAGQHILTFWRNSCISPLGCNDGGPNAFCFEPITVRRGQALLVHVDLSATPCVRGLRPRPDRRADPASVSGRLHFAHGGCAYLLDTDGYFWSLGLPAEWSTDRRHSRIVTASGAFVGHRRDLVRVRGTRAGAYSTECAARILGNRAADYRVIDMRIVQRAS